MAAFAVAECIEVQNHEVQIQVDLKLAARMRFCARETALKWHFHVLRDRQHLTWQTNQGYVRNTQEIYMLKFSCLSPMLYKKRGNNYLSTSGIARGSYNSSLCSMVGTDIADTSWTPST